MSDKTLNQENFGYNSAKEPKRMCVICRDRYAQLELLRLQCKEQTLNNQIVKTLVNYTQQGRSFYICNQCIDGTDEKRMIKAITRQCKMGPTEKLLTQIKEIITDVR